MTAYETIAHFLSFDLDGLSLVFAYLAEHSYEARLQDGKQLRDATDFRCWLRELSEAAKVAEGRGSTEVANQPGRRPCRKVLGTFVLADPCPRCGHVHEGAAECGFEIGGGRICRCDVEVPA
jgi:hypothetical protein